jgi:hypothetical protein
MTPDLTCAACRALLPDYAAGTLAPEQHAAVARHLAGCAACRMELAQWHSISAALHRREAGLIVDGAAHRGWQALHLHLTPPASAGNHTQEESVHPMNNTANKIHIQAARRNPWAAVMAAALLMVLGLATFNLLANRSGHMAANPSPAHNTPTNPPAPVAHIPLDPHTGLASSGSLDAIKMDAPDDGWAVGAIYSDKSGNKRAYTMHYTGGRWQLVGPDYPNANLHIVSVAAPGDVWAGGARFTIQVTHNPDGTTSGATKINGPLLLHYTNGAWHEISIPIIDDIGGISMFPDGTGWVNGSIENSPFLLHWQQGKWTNIYLGTLNNPVFDMFAPNEGWIADNNRLWHYHNGQLTPVTLPAHSFLDSIDMLSSNDGWASGGTLIGQRASGVGGPTHPLLMHYDGTTWQPVSLPTTEPSSNPEIYGISMTSATLGWAVLQTENRDGTPLRYDGQHWTPIKAPAGVIISGISATGPDDAWATGFTGGGGYFAGMPGGPSLLHYYGGAWHVYTQP